MRMKMSSRLANFLTEVCLFNRVSRLFGRPLGLVDHASGADMLGKMSLLAASGEGWLGQELA